MSIESNGLNLHNWLYIGGLRNRQAAILVHGLLSTTARGPSGRWKNALFVRNLVHEIRDQIESSIFGADLVDPDDRIIHQWTFRTATCALLRQQYPMIDDIKRALKTEIMTCFKNPARQR